MRGVDLIKRNRILKIISLVCCGFSGLSIGGLCALNDEPYLHLFEKDSLEIIETALMRYVEYNVNLTGVWENRVSISFGKLVGERVETNTSIDMGSPDWKRETNWVFRSVLITDLCNIIKKALNYRDTLECGVRLSDIDKDRAEWDNCKLACEFLDCLAPKLRGNEFSLILDKLTEKPLMALHKKIEDYWANIESVRNLENKDKEVNAKNKRSDESNKNENLYDQAYHSLFRTVDCAVQNFYKYALVETNSDKLHVIYAVSIPLFPKGSSYKSNFRIPIVIDRTIKNDVEELQDLIINDVILKILSFIESSDFKNEENVSSLSCYFKDIIKSEWYDKRNSETESLIYDLSWFASCMIMKRFNCNT